MTTVEAPELISCQRYCSDTYILISIDMSFLCAYIWYGGNPKVKEGNDMYKYPFQPTLWMWETVFESDTTCMSILDLTRQHQARSDNYKIFLLNICV